MQSNPYKGTAKIHDLQSRKLRKLLNHAYNNVPLYRELYKKNRIVPEEIQSVDQLSELPPTTKQQFSQAPVEQKTARTVDLNRCRSSATSGSTGFPLQIYFRSSDFTIINFTWARAYMAHGMKPWHKIAALIGSRQVKRQKSWYEYFGVWRRKEISTWEAPHRWHHEIQTFHPDIYTGYVLTLRLLAEYIEEEGIQDMTPKTIFHTSAVLDDFSRRYLESRFHTKVIDLYGSFEAGCIAWECEECSGYHISSDTVVVEVLKNGKPVDPGEQGEVYITNLHSYAMPFIRYRQGDVVTLSETPPICGRTFPLLKNIIGRADDFIILKNGRKMSPTPFYHAVDPVPGVGRWRIIQKAPGEIILEIQPGVNFSTDTQRKIKNNFHRLAEKNLSYRIKIVEEIPIVPGKKFRAVSSEISGAVD